MSLTDSVCYKFEGKAVEFNISESERNLQHADDHISNVIDQLKADEVSEGMDPENSNMGEVFQEQNIKRRFSSGYSACNKNQERLNMMKCETTLKDSIPKHISKTFTEKDASLNPDDDDDDDDVSFMSLADFDDNVAPGDHTDNVFSVFIEQNNNLRDHMDYMFRDVNDDDDDDDLSTSSNEYDMADDTSLSFHHVAIKVDAECEICYKVESLYHRHCCSKPYCESCLNTYCQLLVDSGNIKFPCPNPDCGKLIYHSEVYARLEMESKSKLYRNLVNANIDPLKKTCPRCSEVLSLRSDVKLTTPKSKKYGLKVTCAGCQLDWCFHCHAPWHRSMTCSQYKKGDKLVLEWARQIKAGQVNARCCPKCKILIQRKCGCDHMLCSRCGVNFCYRCGCKFRSARFLGDHYSKFGIFGCRYLLFKNKPFLRKLIRGSIFGGKLIVAPVLGALVLVGGIALFAGAVVASPVIAGIAIKRSHKRHRMKIERAEMLAHDEQRIAKIRDQGTIYYRICSLCILARNFEDDPYWDRYSHLQEIGASNMWQLYTATQDQSHETREVIKLY